MLNNLINTVDLAGKLHNHPKVSYLDSGEVKAKALLAVRGKDKEGCDLLPIEMWNNLAIKAVQNTCAGSTIAIQGELLIDRNIPHPYIKVTSLQIFKY